MGYFSNGTEGDIYERTWCSRCVHGQSDAGCAVMLIHLLYNYDQHGEGEAAKARGELMDLLIPRPNTFNEQCSMWVQVDLVEGTSSNTIKVEP